MRASWFARWVGLAALLAASPLPAQQKRIYIAPDDHTDYMWTADVATYRNAFLTMLDYYLDLADTTAGNAPDYQSRFAADGSFWLRTYEQNRTPAQFDRLMGRIADGHISAPMTALVSTYGAQPVEAVLRGMYYAGLLERRYGVRFRMAVAMEDQTLPWGLASLWAGSGARWSWKGICGCVSQIPSAWDRQHDIYWATGPDGARVLMKWNSMLGNNQAMGGYAEAYDTPGVVDYVSTSSAFQARYPYPVIGCFGKGWDFLQTTTDEFVNVARTKTDATRRVIVSNEADFFADFEAAHGAGLPALAVSYGNEWDLYSASMSEVSASVKRSVEKLRAAEALAALVSLFDPAFMNGRQAARDAAFVDLGLYWEHDWTADGPIPRPVRAAWQRQVATEIAAYGDALHSDAVAALGNRIVKTGANTRFYAFNPLGWERTDAADLPWSGPTPVHVVEVGTGLEVPSQIVTIGAGTFLRILASGVPAVGYKTYEVVPGAGQAYSPAATVAAGVIDNGLVRLTLAGRGAITSLVDHTRADREFVQVVSGRAMNDLGAGSGTLATVNAGAVSVTLQATAASPLAHTSAITLYRGSDRIDIENRITQNFGAVTTWGFGFNLAAPVVRHEEIGGIALAKLASAGGQYSGRNARYDWLTLNHFADISGTGNVGMTLSNADLAFFRLGNSTLGTLDAATPLISPLAGGQVDGAGLGIQNQGGDSQFRQRFALRAHDAYDPVAAMKTSLEHQNPLVCGMLSGAGVDLPADGFAAVSVGSPDVLLWALKPAEEGIGQGIVARLWNVTDGPRSATVQLAPSPVALAQRTSHIETDEAAEAVIPAGIDATFAAQQLRTYRLVPLAIADADGDGVLRTTDCDDADPGIWATPGEVRALRLAGSTLSWSPPLAPGAAAPAYDTLRSPLASDFMGPATCIESDDASDLEASDAGVPAPGAVFHYLVRAENGCAAGIGSLGAASNGVPRTGRSCP